MNYKELQNRFNIWWSHLSLREQQASVVGAAVVGLFISYAGIWLPIQNGLADMRMSILKDQKTLRFMQSAEKELKDLARQSQQQSASVTPVELLSIMQKAVEEAGLSLMLTQSKQTASDAIVLRFQKVDFDKLMALLIITLKEYKVVVTQFTATAANVPDLVNVDLTLKING